MDINTALKRARQRIDMPQSEAAKKAKVSQSYLSLIENKNSKKVPTISVIAKLCKAYNIPVSVVMWQAIDINDVAANKRTAFNQLKPNIDALISQIFQTT